MDYSSPATEDGQKTREDHEAERIYEQNIGKVGKFRGDLPGLDENQVQDVDDEEEEDGHQPQSKGWLSAFTSLVSNKQLTDKDLEIPLEKMKSSLIRKFRLNIYVIVQFLFV